MSRTLSCAEAVAWVVLAILLLIVATPAVGETFADRWPAIAAPDKLTVDEFLNVWSAGPDMQVVAVKRARSKESAPPKEHIDDVPPRRHYARRFHHHRSSTTGSGYVRR